MRIAQVAPLFERVPPEAYGGTERVIAVLTEELIAQGHEVTLFATGNSVTSARLVAAVEHVLRNERLQQSWLAFHTIQMDLVSKHAAEFDLIHFHTDYFHFPIIRRLGVPHLTTLHGRLDLPELVPLFQYYSHVPLVSISDSQRTPLPWANWCRTINHGLSAPEPSSLREPQEYFVFIGRISPEKRVDRAIDIAVQCGVPLFIAAKIDKSDEDYYNQCIRPLLHHPLVHFLGELSDQEKLKLLGQAKALLFPIDWPEPFGLVMIEAFSCGTPVIAYRHGSVAEIMEEGITGFIVNDQEQAVQAARSIEKIDRTKCRNVFDRRFTVTHMASNYASLYRKLMDDWKTGTKV